MAEARVRLKSKKVSCVRASRIGAPVSELMNVKRSLTSRHGSPDGQAAAKLVALVAFEEKRSPLERSSTKSLKEHASTKSLSRKSTKKDLQAPHTVHPEGHEGGHAGGHGE